MQDCKHPHRSDRMLQMGNRKTARREEAEHRWQMEGQNTPPDRLESWSHRAPRQGAASLQQVVMCATAMGGDVSATQLPACRNLPPCGVIGLAPTLQEALGGIIDCNGCETGRRRRRTLRLPTERLAYCLPAFLFACLSVCLAVSACLPVCMMTASLPACLLACLLPCLPPPAFATAFTPACVPARPG